MERTLRIFFKVVGQSKVATLASGEITEARHGSAEGLYVFFSVLDERAH